VTRRASGLQKPAAGVPKGCTLGNATQPGVTGKSSQGNQKELTVDGWCSVADFLCRFIL